MEFDNNAEYISAINSKNYTNAFDILNKEDFQKLLATVDENNLRIFKSTILPSINPTSSNLMYYGLSSTDVDMRNDDILTKKRLKAQIDPFSHDSVWAFLDDTKYGVILSEGSDEFTYLGSSGKNIFTMSGNFSDDSELNLINYRDLVDEEISGIFYDDNDSKILIRYNSNVIVYEANSLRRCAVEISTENIILEGVFENSEKIKFGNNFKLTELNNTLYIENKFSSETQIRVDLTTYDCISAIDYDIRNVDDYIAVIFASLSGNKILFVDPTDTTEVLIYELNDFDADNDSKVSFAKFDSNVVILNNSTETQYRAISNMGHPLSRSKHSNFGYLDSYTFGNTKQKWNLSFLKWNSNNLKSNNYNNLLFSSNSDNYYTYNMFHNIGRLYPIKVDNFDNYIYTINPKLEKTYTGISCVESSVGIFFNNTINNILKDSLNIYNQTVGHYEFIDGDYIIEESKDFVINPEDLSINVNETINVIAIQRIFSKIIRIQETVLGQVLYLN
jgi:hypothetical protein